MPILRVLNEQGEYIEVPAIKGDSYIITDEDYNEIAEITKGKLQPSIEELQNSKMSYYMVTVSNGHIYHNDEQLTFTQLVELYNNPSIFLYMEYSHLTLIPNAIADDILAFGTSYFNSQGSNSEQIEIDSNNVVTIKYNALENSSNKVSVINNRNKTSEKQYPSNKAITDYVDEAIPTKTSQLVNDSDFINSSSLTPIIEKNAEQDLAISTKANSSQVDELEAKQEETSRSLSALWQLNEGITYRYEDDSTPNDKVIVSGAKSFGLKELGGNSRKGYQLLDDMSKLQALRLRGLAISDNIVIMKPNAETGVNHGIFISNYLDVSKTYSITFEAKATQEITVYLYLANRNITIGTTPTTFSFTFTNYPTFAIYLNSQTDISNVDITISNIMLNEGSTPLPYEPYTNSIITSNFTDVVVSGKNIIDQNPDNLVQMEVVGTNRWGFRLTNVSGDLTLIASNPTTFIWSVAPVVNGIVDTTNSKIISTDAKTISGNDLFVYTPSTSVKSNVENNLLTTKLQGNRGTTLLPYTPYIPPKSYPLNITLNGIGNIYDTLGEKIVRRIGVVDLGTLKWGVVTHTNGNFFNAKCDEVPIDESTSNKLCEGYEIKSAWRYSEDKIAMIYTNNAIAIRDTAFNDDVASFKASLAGKKIYFVQATPTEEETTIKIADQCEAGGYISFNYVDKDKYALDIPNTIEYFVALNEVK